MKVIDGMDCDDAELVRRYQRGDAAAFAEFTRRHRDRVYRLARLWLRRSTDVDDVVQEVFMRSMSGLTGFLFRAQPATWLTRVTRNVCHEHDRRQRTHADVDDPAINHLLLADDANEGDDLAREHARVRRAVDRLPARQREVVVLRMFEDLPVAETARALGCREGTVKAHLHKALANLRRMLDADGAPPSLAGHVARPAPSHAAGPAGGDAP